ncbi:hypothetical protein DBV05_g2787 [Lasiodiplodia theobromae]|uniref:Uncharacterized protein n=1 Tax=Lasiodiplodia theobromae TaxID=45133 RepID=A0A5N5DLL7_9PEZI|nr:hypothetical protein DBV05_g2787 [Lasiodiplodia theobromae]
MQASQMRARLSTRSMTPDDDVFSIPGSSFFGNALLSSSPRNDSTPPTSDFAGSSHNTPGSSRHRTPVKSLDAPWGVSLGAQDLRFESTPPPSSQFPAACDITPTPAPKIRKATPNTVRPPPCCQISIAVARDFINKSNPGLPRLSNTTDERAYEQWATIVRDALMAGKMFKFVDGSHPEHSGTRFHRSGDTKTADLIRLAYIDAAGCPDPPALHKSLELTAAGLWDRIRAAHTAIPPDNSTAAITSTPPLFSCSLATSSLPSLPPAQPSDHFDSASSKARYLMGKFQSAKLDELGGDVGHFANHLEAIVHRLESLNFPLPSYVLVFKFLDGVECEFSKKVKELSQKYGDALWKGEDGDMGDGQGGGLPFAVVRGAIVEEERRLREEKENMEKDEATRLQLERIDEEERREKARKERKAIEQKPWWSGEDFVEVREEWRGNVAGERMGSEDEDSESSASVADAELERLQKEIQESVESDEADTSKEEEDISKRPILQAKKTSGDGEEQVQKQQANGILQVKDTDDEESESPLEETHQGLASSAGRKGSTTPEQAQNPNERLRVSETPVVRPAVQPHASSKTSSSQATVLAKSPSRVGEVLGDSVRHESSVSESSTANLGSLTKLLKAGPFSSAPATASIQKLPVSTFPLPRDPDEPYSDRESTAAAVQRARGAKAAAKLIRKQRREEAKAKKDKPKRRETKLLDAAQQHESAAGTIADDTAATSKVRRRKTVAEANEAFDREYSRSSSMRTPCYRCKKTSHLNYCQCPWNPSVAREENTGVLMNVAFTRGPYVDFKVEKKEKETKEKSAVVVGKGEDKEKKKKSKKDKREKKKERKRKQREEDEYEVAEVGSPSKTLRRGSLVL